MNPYLNEEVAWQRIKDLQREAENRRLMRAESRQRTPLAQLWPARQVGRLAKYVWSLSVARFNRGNPGVELAARPVAGEYEGTRDIA